MTVTRSRVIVGVDNDPAGLAALRWALTLARSQDLVLIAVRTWQPAAHSPPLPRLTRRRTRAPAPGDPRRTRRLPDPAAQQSTRLQVMTAFWTVAGGVPLDLPVLIETPEGQPAALLTRWACRTGDILVVGAGSASRRRGTGRAVSRYCLAHARCAVVAVPAPRDGWRSPDAAPVPQPAHDRAGRGSRSPSLTAGGGRTAPQPVACAPGAATAERPTIGHKRGRLP